MILTEIVALIILGTMIFYYFNNYIVIKNDRFVFNTFILNPKTEILYNEISGYEAGIKPYELKRQSSSYTIILYLKNGESYTEQAFFRYKDKKRKAYNSIINKLDKLNIPEKG